MPWIREGGKARFVPATPPPEFNPPPRGSGPEAHARFRREREAADIWIRRTVADWCQLHLDCNRIACRRANACRSRDAACHDENLDLLKQHVYPLLFRNRAGAAGGEEAPPSKSDPPRPAGRQASG